MIRRTRFPITSCRACSRRCGWGISFMIPATRCIRIMTMRTTKSRLRHRGHRGHRGHREMRERGLVMTEDEFVDEEMEGDPELKKITNAIIGAAIAVHKELG